MSSAQTITPQEAATLTSTSLFLDVRTPGEFQEVHINGAVSHPLSDLDPQKVRDLAQGRQSTVIVCRSGGRARQAYEKLTAAGLGNLVVLEGGVSAWEVSGLPVARGKKTISLERQVRIAAGALVFLGSLLTYFVSSVFIVIPAFIGAGLVFAGVTDTYGMAMMLARMPWNARTATGAACCVTPKSGK